MMSVAAGPSQLLRARRWRVPASARVSAPPARVAAPSLLPPRVFAPSLASLAFAPRVRVTAALLALAATAILLAVHVQPARAVILPAQTIDGPSEEIVGFGGVAMAPDGTGGVVYLKRVEGVPHVFVSRFVGGHWLPPIRVDTEEPYAASWPRIGAAEGGS